MQSATFVHGVPFRKNPREGQKLVFDEARKKELKRLNVELPTGYGKTFTALGCYAIRKKHAGVTRLLYITPTDAQHTQFINDGPASLMDAGVDGPLEVCDIRYFGTEAIARSNTNKAQVFATTIQALNTASGKDILNKILQKHVWMVCVDELHHYAQDQPWGKMVTLIQGLGIDFQLAMSATPYRPDDNSVFGAPDLTIRYRRAELEGAVKKLVGHSYVYRIDAVGENGDVISFTTNDLIEEAGGDAPEKIEKLRIERKMRWSPKYISPLVSIPIERMLRQRIDYGVKFQMLIGALCVSHAELVCEQIRSMFPVLSVDWVGTGPNGRSVEDNRNILRAFCPPKESNGVRPEPTLDILVHVGIAGEGLDTSLVTEISHLNGARVNNSNNQENGRAARIIYLPNGKKIDVVGNINFDSSSGYADGGYTGTKIMDAMSFDPPSPDDEDEEELSRTRASNDEPIPAEPVVNIWDMSLVNIDSGSPEFQMLVESLQEAGSGLSYADVLADEAKLEQVMAIYQRMEAKKTEHMNSRAVIAQLDARVEEALSLVVGRVIRLMTRGDQRIEKSVAGDLKRRINGRKKRVLGEKTRNEEVLRQHYNFLHNLDVALAETKEIPAWLL